MTFNVGTSLAELQREATIRTFRATCGNHRRAAKILGISPNTLYKALAKYGVEPNGVGSQPDPLSKDFPRQRRILHHLPDENQVKIGASRQPEWPLQYKRCNEWQAIPLVARNDGLSCY